MNYSTPPRSRQRGQGFQLQRERARSSPKHSPQPQTLVLSPAPTPNSTLRFSGFISEASLQVTTQEANAGERLMEKAGERCLCRRYPGKMS